ncbi:MAG: mannose-6-phosphate isomerase, class I [Propionibacteriales bacterium]|nr:mannose-6-phosphate isomerase, class I [Propionibacteriales bacterium]
MRRLDNPVRRFAWGSIDVIPKLLGISPDGEPQAELWIGAHERDSSRLDGVDLAGLVAADPGRYLGARFAGEHRLPFLAKVIAVAEPLSLQVHPDSRLAASGFAAEEAAAVDRDSPLRTYPDDLAKVEMVYAVSPFKALCGFRPVDDLVGWLDVLDLPVLAPTLASVRRSGAAALSAEAERLLTGIDAGAAVAQIESRCAALADDPDWGWSAAMLGEVARHYPEDAAVSLAVLLQPHLLEPGQCLLVRPGQPHTYLGGTAFEVQANSDNTIRAGLTTKHVDVDLLLTALHTHGVPPVAAVVAYDEGAERVFAPDTPRFALSVVTGPARAPGVALTDVPGPEVYCCLDGGFTVSDDEAGLELRAGQAAFAAADGGAVRVSGRGTLLRVTAGRA